MVDANDFMRWMAWAYLAVAAFQALPRVREDNGQFIALIAALGAIGLALQAALPALCGWILAALVFAYLLLPMLLVRRVMTVLGRQRWRTAQALLAVASAFLPLPMQRRQVHSLRTILAIERGEVSPEDLPAQSVRAAAEDPVRVFRLAFACRWRELDMTVGHLVTDADDPSTTLLRMKIAYEVGAFDDALAALSRLERLGGPDAERALAAGRLLLLCAAGDGDGSAAIATRFHQHADYCSYLIATCDWIGGNEARARAALTALAERAIPRVRWLSTYRLANPPPATAALPSAWRERARLVSGDPMSLARRHGPPRMTLAVIAANVAVYLFCLGWWQHLIAGRDLPAQVQENYWEQVLERMGALMVPTSLHDSWRLVTATVLHAGILHIGMNMLNLYLLGRILEMRLGPWRMLTLILVSGIGGNLVFDSLAALSGDHQGIELGASGGVMGLVGALGAMAVRSVRARLPGAAAFLQVIMLTVIVQVIFDSTYAKEVAGTAHLGGLAVGAWCGWFLLASAARAQARSAVLKP